MALVIWRQDSVSLGVDGGGSAAQSLVGGKPGPGESVAASAETKGADASWVWWAYGLIVGAAFGGWGLWGLVSPSQFSPAAGFSAFAPLYLLTQGIERLLEPFTKFLGSSDDDATKKSISKAKAEEARNEAIVALAKNPNPTRALEAAKSQALLERIRKNRTVISWGIASALGMLACGAFGIRLLQATGFNVPAFWDIAITGLAVGSGTKPLHDLIDNLQKSKDAKADPAAVARTA